MDFNMDSTQRSKFFRLNCRKPWDSLTDDYRRKIRKICNDNLLVKIGLPQEVVANVDTSTTCDQPSESTSATVLGPELFVNDSESNYNNNKNVINENGNINEYFIDTEFPVNGQDIHNNSFNNEIFVNNLAKCLIDNGINQTQSRALLRVLRTHPHLLFLPKDPRALMKTSREKVEPKIVPPGEYLHIGLEFKLQSMLSQVPIESIPNKLIIDFSTDGADLNKNVHIWPIQIRIVNLPCNRNPQHVGIYQGPSKPNNFEEFFKDFIDESESIIEKGGINYNNKLIPIRFRCFIGDAPARASVLGHVSHIAKNPCSKCKVEGIIYKRSSRYPGVDHLHRTDKEYRELIDVDHHKNESAIRKLPINLVDQIPFEYMHLVCLGVTKN
ncbi:uncharacterized protein LOC141525944 isoform X1 [Cotesia typhae]|uniref:uncharacterized protein LOC141525944 isoform X1 n=1 Tax=Cotesia typhae TaxID=2053667 RepID=UPI003D686247